MADDFNSRLKRVDDTIALRGEPDRLPMIPFIEGLPYFLYNQASHRAEFYDCDAIVEPWIRYHKEFEPDTGMPPFLLFGSGKANEIAETNVMDWPGKPGTIVPDTSTHQVHEREYMRQEEYDEAIRDWTGFVIRKFAPRAYPGLKGFAHFNITAAAMGTTSFAQLMTDDVIETFDKIKLMAEANRHSLQVNDRISKELGELGFPLYYTGFGIAPFDVISDFLRGTAGMFDDQMECPEKVAALCEVIRDVQIPDWQYFNFVPMPVKRVFFPLHKGMDGFISPKQYESLYWKTYQDTLRALINMGVTPFIYTEGKYDSRIDFIAEQLKEFPGKCLVHFEDVDFKKAKKAFTGIAAISGGLNASLLEWGTKEEVVDRMKWLIDNCAPGGGYLFDTGAAIENAKYENIAAMFETARTYGKK